MNFDLTEEQQMLKDGAARYVEKSYTFDHRGKLARDGGGFSRDTWATFAEMGWLAAGVPEAHGGLGFSAVETSLIAEELGRGLVLEPFVACALLPAALVRELGSQAQRDELLGAIGSGEQLVAVALSEPQMRGDLAAVAARAERQGGGYKLSGRKTLVVGATVADRFLVVARSAGQPGDGAGLSVFMLAKDHPGLKIEATTLLDGSPAGELLLDGVTVGDDALLGAADQAGDSRHYSGLQLAQDEAIVAQCAETVGGLEDVLALCSEYLKTRKQFGVAIGSFQALQHRMADMAIETMQARASTQRALAALADSGRADRSVVISGCKAQVLRSAKFVTAQGIQLHGGYGITEEYRVGHHYRRLVLTDALFGGMEHHLGRYAQRIQAEARALA